ncbi:metal ABC transporter ATP-binding protein [Tumidithrix elongata]
MLEVQQLSVQYQGVQALTDISFRLASGSVIGLIGPNGAGKSTLLKAMLDLVPTSKGLVFFNGRTLKQQRQQVAYLPQRSQIDWDYPITVWNVVMMARTTHTGWFRSPSRQSKEIVREALERVEMYDLRDRQISQLSGGQQQRVFLARAIAQQADLLLLDEPLNAIDKKTESLVLRIYAELKAEGKTLLVSCHEWGDALHNYDELLLLNGQLIAQGSPTDVMTMDNIQRAYGAYLERRWQIDQREAAFFC